MKKVSVNNNIKTAVIAVSILTLIAKLLGFGEKVVLAYFFGTSKVTDVYFSSLAFFMSAIFIVRELLSPTLLPNLIKAIKTSEHEASNLFRIFLYLILCLGILLIFLFYLFSNQISSLIAPGFDAEMRSMQSQFIRSAVPYLGFTLVSVIFVFALHAYKKFLQASLFEVFYKLILLVLLVAFASGMGIWAISLALCCSSFLLLTMYLGAVMRTSIFSNASLELNDNFRKTISLMPPIVIGVVFSHISGLIDNIFASTFPEGSLSQLSFAKKLIDTVLLIGPVAIVTVLYPNLAYHNEKSKKFKVLLNRSLRVTLFFAVPLTFILLFSGKNLISIVFEHGSFGASSTSATFTMFSIYICGLMSLACEPIIVHAYFAKMDTRTPIAWGVICVFINILLTVVFIRSFGVAGIPLAFVISKTVKVIVLSIVFERKKSAVVPMLRYVIKLSLASLTGLVVVFLIDLPDLDTVLVRKILSVLVRSAGFLVIYLLVTHKYFKIYESRYLLQTLAIFRRRDAR